MSFISSDPCTAVGDACDCSPQDDGSVKCWGGNNRGQLGLGDKISRGDNSNGKCPNPHMILPLIALPERAGLKARERLYPPGFSHFFKNV